VFIVPKIKRPFISYVALSRIGSINQLHILENNDIKLTYRHFEIVESIQIPIKNEYERLRNIININ
jgi:hypothetical protein